MWFYRFKHAFIALLLPWLLAVTTQLAGRVYLLTDYCHPELLASSSVDIRRMFLIGGLFDIRIASLMFVPCLLIAGILTPPNLHLVTRFHFIFMYPRIIARTVILMHSGWAVIKISGLRYISLVCQKHRITERVATYCLRNQTLYGARAITLI